MTDEDQNEAVNDIRDEPVNEIVAEPVEEIAAFASIDQDVPQQYLQEKIEAPNFENCIDDSTVNIPR